MADVTTAPLRRPRLDPTRGAAERAGLTRGRLVVVSIVAGYFVALFALGGHSRWDVLGVPPSSPPFADTRSVTSAWECTRRGIPVLPPNPCDPYGRRPANYPRIWLWPSRLGLGQESTVALGIFIAVVFFAAAVYVLPRGATSTEGAIYGLALCTPAVMLGVERGNVDLVLFTLVAAGAALLRAKPYTSAALILLAAILKLFPIFAAAAFFRRPERKAGLIGAGVLGLFGLYALATIDNIRLTARAVPQGDHLSFGLRRFTNWLADASDSTFAWFSGLVHERLGTVGLDVAVVAVVVAVVLAVRLVAPRALPAGGAQRELDLLWAGAAVYVCSYLVVRSWDYRLVFALLTIPQLLRWARERRPVAIVTLVALFAVLTLDAWSETARAATLVQLLLFAGYLAALAGTLEPPRRPARPAVS